MANNAPQSGPVHVVLQPNLDDADTDDLYYPPQDEDASHLQFLRNNPDGFLRVARIHIRGHKVVLVQSRKPDAQLYIAKQCNSFDYSPNEPYDPLAREIRICTLDAVDVHHTIPSGRQFAETLAYQRLERDSRPDALSVLYLRYYNGGGLDGIAERYRVTNQLVPETLIWHVCKSRQYFFEDPIRDTWRAKNRFTGRVTSSKLIHGPLSNYLVEQISHGLRYLHLGLEPGDLTSVNDAYGNAEWDAIFLQDMSPSNIFIHFPTKRDRNEGNTFDDSFPQIVLGDFGLVTTGEEIDQNAHYPDWAQCTAYGIRELGMALRILCFAQGHDEPINGPIPPVWPGRSIEELRGRGIYSDELIDILQRWDGIIADYGEEADMYYKDLSLDDSDWPEGWPTNAWLFDEVLPVATAKVAELRAAGNAPAILRQEVVDQDTQAPTDLTPRVFESPAAATKAMSGYDLNWTMIPAGGDVVEGSGQGSGGGRVASGSEDVQINLNIQVVVT